MSQQAPDTNLPLSDIQPAASARKPVCRGQQAREMDRMFAKLAAVPWLPKRQLTLLRRERCWF